MCTDPKVLPVEQCFKFRLTVRGRDGIYYRRSITITITITLKF